MDLTGSRVLITGGTGFLGLYLTTAIEHRRPARVTAVGRRTCDLTRPDDVRHLFEGVRPNLVFHLAADCGGIWANIRRPGDMFGRNVLMGLNVLNECRDRGVEKVVVVGTSCEYPSDLPSPLHEEDIESGLPAPETRAYGLAKRSLLTAGIAYRAQYGLKVVHPVLANLYGPGDRSTHVVSELCSKAIHDREGFVVMGDGKQSREFLHAHDAALALVEIAEKYDDYEPVNVGTGVPTTIGELVSIICHEANNQVLGVRYDSAQPVGHEGRWLDVSKIRQALGWRATHDLRHGIKQTIESMREF